MKDFDHFSKIPKYLGQNIVAPGIKKVAKWR